MSTEKTDNYYRAVCRRSECTAYTSSGRVGSYWHGPHRGDRHKAAEDYDQHVATRHPKPVSS